MSKLFESAKRRIDIAKVDIERYNILNRIEELNNKVRAIEQWRDYNAIPNIDKSLTEITNIHGEIRNVIVPKINDARTWANNALSEAGNAISAARGIVDTLQNAGKNLKIDVESLKVRALELKDVLVAESTAILDGFKLFGTRIQDAAEGLKDAAVGVGSELKEAVREIRAPLDAAMRQITVAIQRLKRLNPIGAGFAIVRAVEHLLWRGAGGQNAVLPEVLEAFNEISSAFNSLSDNFTEFGATLKNAPAELAQTINTSLVKIQNGVMNFIAGFGNLADNLSFSLVGDVEGLIKAREEQTKAQQERDRRAQEEVLEAQREAELAKAHLEDEERRLAQMRVEGAHKRDIAIQQEQANRARHRAIVKDVELTEAAARKKAADPNITPEERTKHARIAKASQVEKQQLQDQEVARRRRVQAEQKRMAAEQKRKEEADIKRVRAERARVDAAKRRQAEAKRKADIERQRRAAAQQKTEAERMRRARAEATARRRAEQRAEQQRAARAEERRRAEAERRARERRAVAVRRRAR